MARAQAQGHERPGERGEARAAGLGRGVWEGELTRMWAIAGCGRQGGGRSLGRHAARERMLLGEFSRGSRSAASSREVDSGSFAFPVFTVPSRRGRLHLPVAERLVRPRGPAPCFLSPCSPLGMIQSPPAVPGLGGRETCPGPQSASRRGTRHSQAGAGNTPLWLRLPLRSLCHRPRRRWQGPGGGQWGAMGDLQL